MIVWLRDNRVSFGLLVSWPHEGDPGSSIGHKVAILSIDSPSRLVIVGWGRLGGGDLSRLAGQGRRVRLRVLGWLRISRDADAGVAANVLESVKVLGISRMPKSVRLALHG